MEEKTRHEISRKDSDEQRTTRPRWLWLVITTIVGVVATILVGWYQLNKAAGEARKAEVEREKAVRLTIVSIIEEHVLNGKGLDLSPLRRLVEFQAKEQALGRSLPIIQFGVNVIIFSLIQEGSITHWVMDTVGH